MGNKPKSIFNIRFRLEDVNQLNELEKISPEDLNITTNHFKLLPRKADFITVTIPDDDSEGTPRSEATRKVVFLIKMSSMILSTIKCRIFLSRFVKHTAMIILRFV